MNLALKIFEILIVVTAFAVLGVIRNARGAFNRRGVCGEVGLPQIRRCVLYYVVPKGIEYLIMIFIAGLIARQLLDTCGFERIARPVGALAIAQLSVGGTFWVLLRWRKMGKIVRELDYRLCPICMYSLQGMQGGVARCPECSALVRLPELRDAWRQAFPKSDDAL